MQITTERLYLRPINPEDKEDLFAYRSDPVANKYQGTIPKTLEETEEFISKMATKPNLPDTWFQLAVIEKESDKMIGDIGINFHKDDNTQISLGYTIAKQKQGKGFATEALHHTINYLFNQMDKKEISVYIDTENLPSIRLAEKLGFSPTSETIESIINGERVFDRVFILKKEDRA